MTKAANIVVVSAVAALAITWLAFRSKEATISPPPEANAGAPAPSAAEAVVALRSAPAVEERAPERQVSPVATQDQREANAKRLSDAFERGLTPTLVASLTSKGASREDSERIVSEAMRELRPCVREAMPELESAQPAPLAPNAGSPPIALLGTVMFSNDRVQSCMTAVYNRIGLPPATTYEVRVQGGEIEFVGGAVAQ